MKLHYNSPVILTFTLISTVVMGITSLVGGWFTQTFFSTSPGLSFLNPLFIPRLFTHVIGHADWNHLAGNFSLILLIGPLLEEKYGSGRMLAMIAVTAFVTATLNNIFFASGLYGASGVVFMLILLSSFANIKSGHIPLTFVIIVLLFLGKEVYSAFLNDNISQFAHIIGGICGSIFGFSKPEAKTPTAVEGDFLKKLG